MDQLAEQTTTALKRLAKSVSVITTRWNGLRYAMAATAVEGLCLDPPSMLVCVNKTASLWEPLSHGAEFAVNLLACDHIELPARCSAPWQGEERFALGEWSDDTPVPILKDAQASIICSTDKTVPYGTHILIIGNIKAIKIFGDVDPLIYFNGTYHRGINLE
jgi:flavin reductase (DIM6/NTAB) family NADH-FMN oxidoreductase RutF